MMKKTQETSCIVKQFYSKSKDVDDLNIGIPNWRKVISNFYVLTNPICFQGALFKSCEHAFHAAK
eukprot:Pgem_evm1s15485